MQARNTTAKLGTDVKFTFDFTKNDGNKMPIFGIYGIFINRTVADKLDECSAKDNLHRYPHEPHFDYNADAHVLNQSGRPGYNVMPIQGQPKKPLPLVQYPATIQYNDSTGKVDVMFLAESQVEPGDYDLHLYVRTVEDDAFRENNIRKFSLSYESILTLTTESTRFPNGVMNVSIDVY